MKPTILLAVGVCLAAVPAAAQQHQHGQHQHGQHQHGQQCQHAQHGQHGAGHAHCQAPEGWRMRTDRDQPADQVRFMGMSDYFHVVTGPAAVLYHPDWTHRGDFRVGARFVQQKAPAHPESYGIVVGGRALDADAQRYAYLLVRGTGEYFIALRRGAERVRVVDWTAHPAVAKQDDAGRASNELAVQASGADVVFLINGTEVARRPRTEIDPDGVFGFRVNHHLDVKIDRVSR